MTGARRVVLRFGVTGALLQALLVCTPLARAARSPFDGLLGYEKYTLPNGLEVLLCRDSRLPIVAVNLWFHVGAIDERPGRTGFAHLFEHMMFQGSAHVAAGEHLARLEAIGASDLNATTGFDRTNYFETVPSNYLETALWLESDRMGSLLEALTAEKFAIQRQVVKNERRQTLENTPYGRVEEQAWQALFPAPHPYFGNVIGSMADLDAASVGDVREFFSRYYAPANATLALVGDFDPAAAKPMIERYFGNLPSRPEPKQPVIATLGCEHPADLERTLRPNTLPVVWMGWHSPKALAPGDAAADVLASILTRGRSSRLHQRLIRERQLAQSVQAHQMSLAAGSAFVIEATARSGVNPKRLQSEIEAELASIRRAGVSPAEVERARRVIETGIVASLQTVSGRADRLQFYNQYAGDPGYLARDLARYERLTAEDIRNFAAGELAKPACVTLRASPAAAQEHAP